MLIKIDRASIKPNSRAGETITIAKGPASASITVKGEHALFDSKEFTWVEKKLEPGSFVPTITYILSNPHDFPNVLTRAKEQGIYVVGEFKQDHQTYHHEPIAPYTFKYDYPLITCQECGDSYSLSEVVCDYDDDGNQIIYCPSCDTLFELDVTYEDINDVIKELQNKG